MPEAYPLFPLPDLLLYPQALVPLQLFEPRYVRMMRDMLAEGRDELVIAALQPGHEDQYFERPPCYAIAGLGKISHVQETPDGRFQLVLRGETRVRLVEELEPGGLPYRRVKVLPLTEAEPRGEEADRMRADLRAVLEVGTARLARPDEVSLGWLVDVLLVQLALPLPQRHALYSLIDPLERGRQVLATWRAMAGDLGVDPERN